MSQRERGDEGSEDANLRGGDMVIEATAEGQDVFGGGFEICSACVPARTRDRERLKINNK